MKIEILVPLFTLLGVLIGAVSSITVTLINEYYRSKAEKERLIYELGKIYWQEALIQGRNTPGSTVYPLESFIISIKYLFEEITTKKIDRFNIKDVLEKHSALMAAVKEHYDKK